MTPFLIGLLSLPFGLPATVLVLRYLRMSKSRIFMIIPHLRMYMKKQTKTVYDKHTAFMLTVLAVLLPLQMAACLTAEQATEDSENDEKIRNIACNVMRDCMVTNAGTFYFWALLTTIFR